MEKECSVTATLDCDVVILCGGLGTRLRPAVADRPKPMASVAGRPFLDILIDELVVQGCRRIIFSAGYKSEWIAAHLAHEARFEAMCSIEAQPLGTAGALARCRPHLRRSAVLVCNGDSYCEVNVEKLLREHRGSGCVATMVVVPADGRTDVGNVTLGAWKRVSGFSEKQAGGAYLNAGVYVFDSALLTDLPVHVPASLERDWFPGLVSRGLHGVIAPGPVYDIGTPERLEAFRKVYVTQRVQCSHILQGGME
jgi:NDP-sugar pyrophosphorylase family protein